MGPEEKNGQLYIRTGEGWKALRTIENLELTPIDTEIDQIVRVVHTDNYSLPLPKEIRCHSRKRFIKLSMSLGYPKRIASFLADMCISLLGSYQRAYLQLYLMQSMYQVLISSLTGHIPS